MGYLLLFRNFISFFTKKNYIKTLFLVDILYMKDLNAIYGFENGDFIIRQLSLLLKSKINNQLLVTYGWAKHTTKYAYFDDTLVNAKIALYQWMAEDEPKDIKLISELIVRDLKEIGK